MKVLLVADLHLRNFDRTWMRYPDLRGDAGFAVEQIRDIARDHDARTLFLAGDIFNAKEQRGLPLALARWLCQPGSFDTVYYVCGQHERMGNDEPELLTALHSEAYTADRVIHVDQQCVELDGKYVYGLDYRLPRDVKAALEAVPPDVDILLTHQVWQEFMGETRGNARADWLDGQPLILTGDYHCHVITKWKNKQGELLDVISPGPVCLQRINEQPDKYMVLLEWDGVDSKITWQSIPLRTRPVRSYADVFTPKRVRAFVKSEEFNRLVTADLTLPLSVRKPIIMFSHTDSSVAADFATLEKACEGRAFPFCAAAGATDDDKEVAVTDTLTPRDAQELLRETIYDIAPTPEVAQDVITVLEAAPKDLDGRLGDIFEHKRCKALEESANATG